MGGALVLDQGGFGGQHFQVAGDSAFVALVGNVVGVLCGGHSPLLDGGLLLQDAQAGELVFNIFKGEKDGALVSETWASY